VITGARGRDIRLVATNSDGDPGRRRFLLDRLGPGAVERIVDPSVEAVSARLADPMTLELSVECEDAIGRGYRRL